MKNILGPLIEYGRFLRGNTVILLVLLFNIEVIVFDNKVDVLNSN